MSEQEESSTSDEGRTSGSRSGSRDEQTEISDQSSSTGRNERKLIKRSKGLVYATIAVAAAACGTATYLYAADGESDDFTHSFFNYAVAVVDSIHLEAHDIFGAVDSLATSITSFAIEMNNTWPLLSVPHFEVRGYKSNKISRALQISMAPLVRSEKLEDWELYSIQNQGWIGQGLLLSKQLDIEAGESSQTNLEPIFDKVWRFANNTSGRRVPSTGLGYHEGPGHFAPVWQQSPAPTNSSIINYDLLSHPVISRIYHGMWESRLPVLSEAMDLKFLYSRAIQEDFDHPHSLLLNPVYSEFVSEGYKPDRNALVGFLVAILPWDSYFVDILPSTVKGMVVVLHDTCGGHMTYRIDGPQATFLGSGDLHDPQYNNLGVHTDFAPFLQHNFSDAREHCEYDLQIFPSTDFESDFKSSQPLLFASVVVLVFAFTALTFFTYDCMMERRQQRVSAKAKRSDAILSSLFPSNVRDRMLKDAEEHEKKEGHGQHDAFGFGHSAKNKLSHFLSEEKDVADVIAFDTKPIAELFPNCTLLFADIVGFTAWSSVREPFKVFMLLETIFNAFDVIARRRRVFKVETVGDCYVAVSGLPEPRKDHAVVMARFARDCLVKANDLFKKLEVSLGPDTGDLAIRLGLHSGPVTAGVLRGDKSRFQLFGDTINTCSRIEQSSALNCIQASNETAQLLIAAGKGHWIRERSEAVHAKGKGELHTYWIDIRLPSRAAGGSSHSQDTDSFEEKIIRENGEGLLDDKVERLVTWHTEVLARLLRQIVARRSTSSGTEQGCVKWPSHEAGQVVLDEVKEIIYLPEYKASTAQTNADSLQVDLGEDVTRQLHEYVDCVASMYRFNAFHCFEHAAHVSMSVVKLLSRIVVSDDEDGDIDKADDRVGSMLHDHTYGITSDPLTQFACVFSALIHDIDHPGVPNSRLVQENTTMASVYNNKSVAEQNSVDLAWDLLAEDGFKELRQAICSNEDELCRFRQLVVNSVMATDIADPELKRLRNGRWDKAFQLTATNEPPRDHINRKATIVIEHLIQASDVAHTMQHWHVYQKWNERLFHEMLVAYQSGRAEKDPSEFWYQGELGFFDHYIIPLSKKLADCGVFGVSSDEYLNYAMKNREEWEIRGRDIVASYVEKYKISEKDASPLEEKHEPSLLPPSQGAPERDGHGARVNDGPPKSPEWV